MRGTADPQFECTQDSPHGSPKKPTPAQNTTLEKKVLDTPE